ncbi:MAG: universal stress protein [Paludibacteraceae bacterium]|nr:universal stress protein [Paludibacteraceae bacterium]
MLDDIRYIHCLNRSRIIQQHLNDCRDERRPYVFITDTMTLSTFNSQLSPSGATTLHSTLYTLNSILVPISMLEEEVYKSEICTYLARKTGAEILLLLANDYGTKAKQNLDKIITHIEKVKERTGEDIRYRVLQAKKNSFSLAKEAVERQSEWKNDLLILTASREYGLDDILFGPPERHAIARSRVPVMLINPRADLFSLCD